MKEINYTLFGYACVLLLCLCVAFYVSDNFETSSGAAWQTHGYSYSSEMQFNNGAWILAKMYTPAILSQREIDSLRSVPVSRSVFDTIESPVDTILIDLK